MKVAVIFGGFFVSLLSAIFSVEAIVPLVKLCDYDDCPTVSRIGLGTLHLGDKISGLLDAPQVNQWIRKGLDLGINLFDTADVYPVKGGQAGDAATLLGKGLQLTPGLRNKIKIVCKLDMQFPSANETFVGIDTSTNHIESTVDWFLSALQTKYLDIVLLHYPDSFMNAAQVAATFASLKNAGKVHYFGVSNHYPTHMDVLQKALNAYDIKLVTNEIELSVWNPSYLNYNSQMNDHAQLNGYRNLGWGPLGGDPLGGRNRLFVQTGRRQDKILGALSKVGSELGVADNATVALAWALAHPSGIIPLIGTTSLTRMESLITALDIAPKITPAQWWEIGGKGGLCAFADSQCNYRDYM